MAKKFSSEDMENSLKVVAGDKTSPVPSPNVAKKLPVRPPAAAAKRSVAAAISTSEAAKTRVTVVEDEFDHEVAIRLGFLGAGQGGGRMTAAFHDLGYRRAAVFNTTDMDFADIPDAIPRLSLDVGGAAKDTVQAAKALRGREEEVRELLSTAWGNNVEHGMLTVGLGGGTGGGTAKDLIAIAKEYLKDTCGHSKIGAIVSLPPVTEGFQVARNAVNCFQELVELDISPLIVVDNARIQQVYSPSISRLHATSNEIVSQLLHIFNELGATKSSMITFDQAELAQLFDSGLVVLGGATVADNVSEIDSLAMVSSTVREQLNASVLAATDLGTGDKGVCLFVGDQETMDTLSMDYFEAGFTQVDRLLGSSLTQGSPSVLHRGVYLGEFPGMQVYTMLGGLDLPRETLKRLAEKGGLTGAATTASCRIADWLNV